MKRSSYPKNVNTLSTKKKEENVLLFQNTDVFPVNEDLFHILREVEGNSIAYATIEGLVEPVHQKLRSKHGPQEGVIQQWQVVEHKSKRIQGFWFVTFTVLFYLFNFLHLIYFLNLILTFNLLFLF